MKRSLRSLVPFSLLPVLGVLLGSPGALHAADSGEGVVAEYPVEPAFRLLRFGEVMPKGWIQQQFIRDLQGGFAGLMQQVAPFTSASDIFGANRNTPEHYQNAGGGSWGGAEGMWWKGETEGNWTSGNIMMSVLADDPALRAKADQRVATLLATQDPDGYLGIYGPTLRFPAGNIDQGELWTQTTILRGLLAYYEATGKPAILQDVERSVRLTMSHYGANAKDPYGPDAMGHNLMYVDVIERLYDLTGNKAYRDYGIYLYRDYSKEVAADISLPTLLAENKPLMGHGATTYEALRVPLWAGFASGDPVLLTAGQQAFAKSWVHVSPTGGPVSNEMIANKPTDPDLGGYEGCAEKEWMTSLLSAAQKTGGARFAEQAETTYYNSVQGSRLSDGTAVDYVTTDNIHKIDGAIMNRCLFSPAHEDVANCCAPNFVQIGPIFVRSMWMRAADGLALVLYGPTEVTTTVKGKVVHLAEETTYPFSDQVVVHLTPSEPIEFFLHLRVPSWATTFQVTSAGAEVHRVGDWVLVGKKWQKGDSVAVTFGVTTTPIPATNGEFYLRRGPLFYAVGVPGIKQPVKNFPLPQFHDYTVSPVEWEQARFGVLKMTEGGMAASFKLVPNPKADAKFPWDSPPAFLEGTMQNLNTGKVQSVDLVPMGAEAATLRKMTFSTNP
jgi:DUF1680 family protein